MAPSKREAASGQFEVAMIRSSLALCVALSLGIPSLQAQEKFLGKTVDGWGAQLKNADAKQRRSAAFALGKMGGRSIGVVPAMKQTYAQEKDAKVRDAIVFALGEICRDEPAIRTDGDLEALFLNAILDADPHLRRSAAYALGCLRTKSAATRNALDKALGDQEPMVRQNAAFALAQFAESAIPSLKKALVDNDSLVKRDAASVVGQMEDGDKARELLNELLPLCRDNNSEVRRAALNVLVRIVDRSDKAAIPSLKWALEDRDIDNKRNAALALSNIGGEETAVALPVLLETAKNGDADLRRQALMALRNLGPAAASAVPELVRYLNEDPDPKMRENAAIALQGIGKGAEPAIPSLIAKIQDKSEDQKVRIECAMAMNRIGPIPSAAKVAPTLLEVLGDPRHDAKVRERVMWSLRPHGGNLNKMNGTFETFAKVCKEQVTFENKMLRYDSAYMLGMIWQQQAPDQALDVLLEFLRDDKVKVYVGTQVTVGGGGVEGPKGKGSAKEEGKGDGRVMVCDALKMTGPGRYARADILKQLNVLNNDPNLDKRLREKVVELLKAAQ